MASLTERIFGLRRSEGINGIANILGLDPAEVAATLKNPNHTPSTTGGDAALLSSYVADEEARDTDGGSNAWLTWPTTGAVSVDGPEGGGIVLAVGVGEFKCDTPDAVFSAFVCLDGNSSVQIAAGNLANDWTQLASLLGVVAVTEGAHTLSIRVNDDGSAGVVNARNRRLAVIPLF